MKIVMLKKLVELPLSRIERYTREHPEASLVWEGLVVKEFMQSHGIEDATHGVRAFYAFKRAMVQRMNWVKRAS